MWSVGERLRGDAEKAPCRLVQAAEDAGRSPVSRLQTRATPVRISLAGVSPPTPEVPSPRPPPPPRQPHPARTESKPPWGRQRLRRQRRSSRELDSPPRKRPSTVGRPGTVDRFEVLRPTLAAIPPRPRISFPWQRSACVLRQRWGRRGHGARRYEDSKPSHRAGIPQGPSVPSSASHDAPVVYTTSHDPRNS